VATETLAGASRQSSGRHRGLAYAENTGGFLNLGASLPPAARTALFTVATGLLLLALIAYSIRECRSGWWMLGLALFVGGGVSNWIDADARQRRRFQNAGIGWLRMAPTSPTCDWPASPYFCS
jgi:hypothetical protein